MQLGNNFCFCDGNNWIEVDMKWSVPADGTTINYSFNYEFGFDFLTLILGIDL